MTDPKIILCPVDFSEYSTNALEYAAKIASAGNARLHILYVLPQLNYYDLTMTGSIVLYPGAEEVFEKEKAHAEERSVQLLDEWMAKYPEVNFTHQVYSYGQPGESIVNAANEIAADLIVLGSHGRRGLSRLLMGSVAEYVLRHAHCAVIIYKK